MSTGVIGSEYQPELVVVLTALLATGATFIRNWLKQMMAGRL